MICFRCSFSLFAHVNRCSFAGFINFSEYATLASNHPSMLSQMTLNVSGLIASRTNSVMNMDLSDDDEDKKGEGKE